jgi:outer membrane protein assembly factor BamC
MKVQSVSHWSRNLNCIKALCLVTLSTLLTACSWFYSEEGLIKDTTYDYIKAGQIKDIELPPSLVQKNRADFAPIPTIGEKASTAPMGSEVKLSAPVQILAVLDNVRVDNQANNPAVFIIEKSEFIWESLLDLFSNSESELELVDKEQWLIQTDWLAVDERGIWLGLAGSDEIDDFRAKFQIKITDGVLRDEQRLVVKRIAAEKFDDDSETWQPVPSFWQDSAEMLNLLISNYDKLAVERDKRNRASMIAGFQVQLAQDEDDAAALVTDASLEHVWEKLPNVLKELDFEVNDRDRRLMTYFVQYKFEEPGFFASLFNSEKEPLPLESGDYQVTLRQLGERTAIVFRDGQGAPLNSTTMVKLYPALSRLFGSDS